MGKSACRHAIYFTDVFSWLFFGFREVYRTTDPATGKLLAIKKIKMKDESDGVSRAWSILPINACS